MHLAMYAMLEQRIDLIKCHLLVYMSTQRQEEWNTNDIAMRPVS